MLKQERYWDISRRGRELALIFPVPDTISKQDGDKVWGCVLGEN